ncbi:site-specific integrase [Saccharopolyspora pogona]|uniref:site-specific integrase n=1 Tax=Saccharopolyspora pogona TaxID=333966 RepID=UPI001681F8AF|nr:tyrosine-type recombinase/integrase [Saccharopolyspora pogona]
MYTLQAEDMSADARRSVRTVLSGIFGLAVGRDLMPANPVRQMSPIKGGARRKARAMTADEMHDFLAKLGADKIARRYDLPDFVRFMLGTGVRIGEALAMRWCDLDMDEGEIHITGDIVPIKGKGRLVRNDGKSFSAQRVIAMPNYLHTLLSVRRPPGALDDEPVFPAGALTPAAG